MHTFKTIFVHLLRIEFKSIGKLITPLLFGVSLLVLFSFAFADLPSDQMPALFIATTTLTAFLALQLAFTRAYEFDEQDRVFSYLRTYPISSTAWYLAKFAHVLVTSFLVLAPVFVFSSVFHGLKESPLFSWSVLCALFGVLIGLASMGVLLATLTLKVSAKHILFPLLYFPLVSPILIAAVETGLSVVKKTGGDNQTLAWLGLIAIFDVVYFALGVLFFEDVIQTS